MLDRYRRRRVIAIGRLGGKCTKCGSVENLQFDHIEPAEKSFTITKMWSVSEERFTAELEKCQLLCVTCHQDKTNEQLGRKRAKGTHGTLSSYRYCKCDMCKKAAREYSRVYRARKRSEKKKIGRAHV